MAKPKKKGKDNPPGNPTPEEVQFQRDLETAIQRSMEEAYNARNRSAAATIEIMNSDNKQPLATGDSNETLPGCSSKDEREENTANHNTAFAVDNQNNIREEGRTFKREDDWEDDSSSGGSGRKLYSNRERSRQRSISQTGDVAGDPEQITAPLTQNRDRPREIDPDAPRCPVGEGAVKKMFRPREIDPDAPRCPVGEGAVKKMFRPREIDPDAPRCPVGEGAVKKMFRQPTEPPVATSSPAEPGTADKETPGQSKRGADVSLGVWQYPLPKRPLSPQEFTRGRQIPKDETRKDPESEDSSETESSDGEWEVEFQKELKAQQQPGFANTLRKRWSKPYPIGADNIAYLQKQEAKYEERKKDEPHTRRNIFEEIRRWELREMMEAAKRARAMRGKQPAVERVDSQQKTKEDNQQPPATKGSNKPTNGRYDGQPLATRDSNRPTVSKEEQTTDGQKKTIVSTEQLKKITVSEGYMKDAQAPQKSTLPVVVSAVLKKEQQAAPGNTKEMSTEEEQSKYTELLLRDIVRVFFEKKSPGSADSTATSVQQKYLEPQVGKGRRPPFYKKETNCSRSRVSHIPLKITGNQTKSTGKQNIVQTVPEDEHKIREITKKLLEDIKEVDLKETTKDQNQEGLDKTNQEQTDGNVSKNEKQQVSDAETMREKKTQLTSSVTDSADSDNEFSKLHQICVDEKELTEKQAEAADKISSDRCKKFRYIWRRTKSMDRRRFTVTSTLCRGESDARLPSSTANQEHNVAADETQCPNVTINTKTDIQALQKTVYKENLVKEMQSLQHLQGQEQRQTAPKGTATEKELAKKETKEKNYGKELQSQKIIANVAENISDHKSTSTEKVDCQNMLPKGDQTSLKEKHDKAANTESKLGETPSKPHQILSSMTEEEAHNYLWGESNYERSVAKRKLDRPDFLRMIPTFYQNGCARPDTPRQKKGGGGSVSNVPPIVTDIEDESVLEELIDSFDIVKQDISVIQEDIRRRAQKYGYLRVRRRRMASGPRNRKTNRSVNRQRSVQTDDRKETTQPKTGSLRKLPSTSSKGEIHSKTLYGNFRKLETATGRSSKEADGGAQVDGSSAPEQRKVAHRVPVIRQTPIWKCSKCFNTKLRNGQCILQPRIQEPAYQKNLVDTDKGNQAPDQQPGSLRKLTSTGYKGEIQSNMVYDNIRKQETAAERSSKEADDGAQVDGASAPKQQKVTHSVPTIRNTPVRKSSKCVNTNLHNGRSILQSLIQEPPSQEHLDDMDKETKAPDQQTGSLRKLTSTSSKGEIQSNMMDDNIRKLETGAGRSTEEADGDAQVDGSSAPKQQKVTHSVPTIRNMPVRKSSKCVNTNLHNGQSILQPLIQEPPSQKHLDDTDKETKAPDQQTGSLRNLPSTSSDGEIHNNTLFGNIRKLETGAGTSSNVADSSTQVDGSSAPGQQKVTHSAPAIRNTPARKSSKGVNTDLHNGLSILQPPIQEPPSQYNLGDRDEENQAPDQQLVGPVANGIAKCELSNSEPPKELDSDEEDETEQIPMFEISQEQSNIMQAAIRNYLRTFGLPVERVISVSFVQDESFVADENAANGELASGEELSSDDSSEQNDVQSSADDEVPDGNDEVSDSDDELDEGPEEDLDR